MGGICTGLSNNWMSFVVDKICDGHTRHLCRSLITAFDYDEPTVLAFSHTQRVHTLHLPQVYRNSNRVLSFRHTAPKVASSSLLGNKVWQGSKSQRTKDLAAFIIVLLTCTSVKYCVTMYRMDEDVCLPFIDSCYNEYSNKFEESTFLKTSYFQILNFGKNKFKR